MTENIITLRREKALLLQELNGPLLSSFEHGQAKDGVDYRYMRAVRIQSIDREINKLVSQNIKVVT